jgi:predicted transcriptional regulator of viral defense system
MIWYTRSNMSASKSKRLLKLLATRHVLRPRDLREANIPRNYLTRLVKRGQLQRLGRGLYATDQGSSSEYMSLIELAHRVPKAVVCLLSALRFHQIGTQAPSEVWIALDVKAWEPKIKYPPIRLVRFSGNALRFGVQEHRIDGARIRVYSPAKTVADCFKFRHKIGNDVALEALRECYRHKKASMDELWEAAKVCRVANVMRPYMESLA